MSGRERDPCHRGICGRVDALPLALELAAAWSSVYRPAALLAQLSEPLSLPEGARDLPERQRTLGTTIAWSYQLLTADLQELFRDLGCFVGGVRADSAEAIWGPHVTGQLRSLVENSLLRLNEDSDGEPHFWMLETIRSFALEQAKAAGTLAGAADRHAEYFHRLSVQAAPHIRDSGGQAEWLERLEHDRPNLRVALDHLISNAPDEALLMATNLSYFWRIRGDLRDGLACLNAALRGATLQAPGRAQVLYDVGNFALALGHAAEAKPMLLEALPLAEAEADRPLTALILSKLSYSDAVLGRPEAGLAQHQEAMAIARDLGDDSVLNRILNNYIVAYHADDANCVPTCEEALEVSRRLGSPFSIATGANNLAAMAIGTGDLDRAEPLVEECLERASEIGATGLMCGAFECRAEIALMRGDYASAAVAHRQMSDLWLPFEAGGDVTFLSLSGCMAAAIGDYRQAATLWSAAQHTLALLGLPEPLDTIALRRQWLPRARAAISAADWDAACIAGRALSREDAVTIARSITAEAPTGDV